MFKQTQVFTQPPMIVNIVQVFPWAAKEGVLFSWGNTLYNPSKVELTPMLIAHEAVHGNRQVMFNAEGDTGRSVEEWWEMYLNSTTFRLNEELLAHKAEIAEAKNHLNRHLRRQCTVAVARRLSSLLYGNMVSYREAMELLK